MKFLLKALLAATALIPVATAATAQDAPRQRGERGEGRRADRPDRVHVDRDQSRRGDRAAGRDGIAGTRADVSLRRDDARVETQGGAVARPDRSARRDANPDGVMTRADTPAAWRGGSDGRGMRAAPRDQGSRDDRRGDLGAYAQRDRDGARNDNGWRGNNDRSDRGAYAQRDRNGDRNGNGWRGDNRNDRSAWNRGWRGDRRYDYGNYRNANRGAYRLPRYYAPYGWNGGYRRFSVGFTLTSGLFGQNYWIADPYAYRLPAAYGPYRWVRYYNDALLVDIRYGQVVDVVHDIFW